MANERYSKTQKNGADLAEKKEKSEKIKAEEARLRQQFAAIEKSKQNLVEATIEDAAFCRIEMGYLRESVLENGTMIEYKNGENQYGLKQSPDAELYIKLSQRLDAAVKTLLSCMPKERVAVVDDGFDDFVGKRDKG